MSCIKVVEIERVGFLSISEHKNVTERKRDRERDTERERRRTDRLTGIQI